MACALHPDQPAVDTCVHCGHFMCRFCGEDGTQERCPTCRSGARAEMASGGALAPLLAAPLSLGALCSAAWSALQREPVMLSLAAFVTMLLAGTAGIPEKIVDKMSQRMEDERPLFSLALVGLSLVLGLLQLGVQGPLLMGEARMSASVLAGRPVDGLGALFSQWRKALRYLGSMALAGAVALVVLVPFAVVMAVWAEEAGYETLLLWFAFMVAISPLALWFALPLLLAHTVYAFEEDVRPVPALRRCYALAKGRRLLLLGVGAVAVVASLLGFLACCLGLIPAYAFIQALLTATYLRLRDEEQVQVL